MKTAIPSLGRRSPVQDLLEPLNPVWSEARGMAVVLRFADPEDENVIKERLALADLSCLPRMGLKGAGVLSWLQRNGLEPPRTLYSVAPVEGRGILARVDTEEVFLEDGLQGQVVSRLEGRLSTGPSDVYRVERQEASFLLSGAGADEVLSQTCGCHFRESEGRMVLSRLAGVYCRLLPVALNGIGGYRIWLDPSYSVYLWETLLGIVREGGGDAVGLDCIHPGLSPASPLKGWCL